MQAILRRLAMVGAAAGLALLLLAAVLYGVNRSMETPVQMAMGVGGVLLLAAAALRPDAIQRVLAGRRVKYGSNSLVMTLAFVGILVLVNFLAQRHVWRVDLTETGEFTLSPQTRQILTNLDAPVKVVGFYQSGDPRERIVRDLLAEYQMHTGQISVEFHDPDLERRVAAEYQPTNYGALVFLSEGRRYESFGTDEQALTSAIVRVRQESQKGIYFVAGHGERSLDNLEGVGLSSIRAVLERENYRVGSLNLSTLQAGVPEDAAVLVIAGPQREYFEREVALLKGWLAEGGRLLLLYEPGAPAPLADYLQKWGVTLGDDFIVDPANALIVTSEDGEVSLPDVLLLRKYPYHPITRDLQNFLTYFPVARSLRVDPGDEVTVPKASPLVSTSPQSWAETGSEGNPQFDEAEDAPGPLHVGVAIEDPDRNARLVVFGDSDFVTNQGLSGPVANVDLFVNCVNWLADDKELISIRKQPPVDRRLQLLPMQRALTLYTVVALIPLLVVGTGVAVWWRRR